MAETRPDGSKRLLGISAVTPLDDGGVSAEPLAVVSSNMTAEETEEVAKAIYGMEFEVVEQGVKRASHKSSVGYTGRWNSPWDPKGPERTDDGLILQ